MTTRILIYSGVTYDNPANGSTTFALTTSGGLSIGYLSPSHIHVYRSDVGSELETELLRPSQWDFDPTGTAVVLKTPVSGSVSIRLRRMTPADKRFTLFQKGTLLTSEQLNASANFNLFVIQEYYDSVKGDGAGSDAGVALARATEALARANDAMIAAGDAITTASDAEATANSVSGTASNALTQASTANQTANTADGKATSALSQITSINTKADDAVTKAEAALAAVSDASVFVPIANVAAIPANPTLNMRVEVRNSTGIQNRVPAVAGLPSGFVGSSELFVRMSWTGAEWQYDRHGALDPDARYVKAPLPTATTSTAGLVQLSNATNDTSTSKAATAAAVKAAYDAAQNASSTASSASTAASSASNAASNAVDTANAAQAAANAAQTAVNNALPKSGGTMTGAIVLHSSQAKAGVAGAYGIATLSSAIDSSSETTAATSKAVKDAIAAAGGGGGGGLPTTGGTLTGNLVVPSLNGGALGGFRNVIVNGDFRFSQRGVTFNKDAASNWTYSVDRWLTGCNGTGFAHVIKRLSFSTGQTDVPGEPQFYLQFEQTSTGSGNTATYLSTRLRNVRTLAGQQATLSFWMNTNKNMTMSNIVLAQQFGTGNSPSGPVYTSVATNVTLAQGWSKYTYTFTVPTLSGKKIGSNGNDYLDLSFVFPGTTFTVMIARVQLEAGPVATPFEFIYRHLEQALCQAFYFRSVAPGYVYNIHRKDSSVLTPMAYGLQFPMEMRGLPTLTLVGATGPIVPENITSGGARLVVNDPATNTQYKYDGYEVEAEL